MMATQGHVIGFSSQFMSRTLLIFPCACFVSLFTFAHNKVRARGKSVASACMTKEDQLDHKMFRGRVYAQMTTITTGTAKQLLFIISGACLSSEQFFFRLQKATAKELPAPNHIKRYELL